MDETRTLGHFIDGEFESNETTLERLNPSDTSDLVVRFPAGDADAVSRAVSAARTAFPKWRQATPEQRADVLDRAAALILARADALGAELAREEGKTRIEARGEVIRAGRIMRYFAGEALRARGAFLASVRPGVEVGTRREPVGVYGLITPWNFPIAIPVWKAAPALAFGNTVVMKPSELSPGVAASLAEILSEAGLPAGVFNLVFGAGEAGRALVDHSDVDGVSFTGSVATGRRVVAGAASRGARVQAEMGGKNPLVVLDDADLPLAVAIAADGAFFATGQRCTASSRLIVTDKIHDRFTAALGERIASLKVGHALASDTQIGPLASLDQLTKTRTYTDLALSQGGTAVQIPAPSVSTQGYYAAPVLLTNTDMGMRINREEVFGPVASVIRVAGYDEALAVANDTDFGLSAGIVTTSLKHAHDFQTASRAGMVMVNLATAGVDYHAPFGGSRASSFGPREQGFAAIDFYTQTKTTYLAA